MGVQQHSSVNKLGSVGLGEGRGGVGKIDHQHNIDLPGSVTLNCFSCSEIREEFDRKM